MVNDYTFQDITIKKNLKIKKKIYFNQYFEIKQQSSAQKSNKLSQLEQNQDAKTQKSLSNTQNISQKKEIIDNLDSINLQAQAQLTINSDFSDNQQINQFDSIQVLEQGDLSYELRIWDRDQAKKDAINTLDLKYSNRVDVILDNLLQKQYYLGKFIAKGGQGAVFEGSKLQTNRQQIYNGSHPDVSNVLNNIGILFRAKCNYQSALQYLNESINIIKQIFNNDHPNLSS
ncbi:hypothetical protein ABPG74_011713 [Tetrahymena malaccensis]